MSLFDFFFPDQAQASHLRSLVKLNQVRAYRDRKEQSRSEKTKTRLDELEKQVDELVEELAESNLVTQALVKMITHDDPEEREHFKNLIAEIDASDGVTDGKVMPIRRKRGPKFMSKRSWEDETKE